MGMSLIFSDTDLMGGGGSYSCVSDEFWVGYTVSVSVSG